LNETKLYKVELKQIINIESVKLHFFTNDFVLYIL